MAKSETVHSWFKVKPNLPRKVVFHFFFCIIDITGEITWKPDSWGLTQERSKTIKAILFQKQIYLSSYNQQLHEMFYRHAFRFSSFFRGQASSAPASPAHPAFRWLKRMTLPAVALTYYTFMPSTLNEKEEVNWQKELLNDMTPSAALPSKPTVWSYIWSGIVHALRFLQLLVIFAPSIILSPLLLFKKSQDFWFQVFVKAIERSGVVFIKTFQYLSHRRDIIGPELAHQFEYLRENAPTHSFQTTKEYFKNSYGRKIQEIFEEFDPIPIASGSVSQVYRAKYKGKKVAVKVRHPNVDKHIERDVNLLFFMSYLASFITPAMEIPISKDSLKKTLTDQIDFTFEMRNLNKFRQMFKCRSDVDFPSPYEESTKDTVLVEEFIEGVPVTYFENNKHKLNKVIAKLGSEVLFEMLMKNNFVHADCHGGNIFITTIQEPYNFFTEVWDFLKDVWYVAQFRIMAETISEVRIKQVYLEYCQQEMAVRKLIRTEKQKVRINLLDAGMVVELNPNDKRNFSRFIKSVIECRGNDCAEMIFNLSNYEGKKITQEKVKFDGYHKELTQCFDRLNRSTYSQLEGMALLWDMMRIIRENKMKLDGQFATLLTNIIVLEGIGRSLDPDINILKCAFPYFKYIEDEPMVIQKEDSKITLF